jgi:hypothetical protein
MSEDMDRALEAVKTGSMGYLWASKVFNVPKTTLERRVKGKNKLATGSVKILGNIISVLPSFLEDLLVKHILEMETALFGLTIDDVRRLAFELAELNNIPHKFNRPSKMAGKSWLYGFLRRHPEVSLRKPENTSAARAKSFNSANVKKFFALYKSILDTGNFPPHRIYNCDETGITTVPNNPPRILAATNKKQVGTIASGERGVNTTTLICSNAVGNFIPPLFIFPRVKNNPALLRDAPEGSYQNNFSTGYMQTEIFHDWIERFIKYTSCSKEHPVLLILDGHSTHVKSISTIELARSHGLTMIALPPHCTHRMQPLDVAFMKPLSSNFSREVQLWMRKYPGQTLSLYDVAGIFAKAYEPSIQPSIISSGFKACGLWPLDDTVYDKYFTSQSSPNDPNTVDVHPDNSASQPHDSPALNTDGNAAATENELDSSSITLPEDMTKIPEVSFTTPKKGKKRRARAGKTAIITSSPYLKELTLAEENKSLKEELSSLKKEMKKLKKGVKITNNKDACAPDRENPEGNPTIVVGGKMKKRKVKKESKKVKKTRNTVLNIEEQASHQTDDAGGFEDPVIVNVGESEISEDTFAGNSSMLMIEVGNYVLVEFTGKKDNGALYVGCVIAIDQDGTDKKVKTKFLRRADLKKNNAMKFKEVEHGSEEESCTEHSLGQVKLVLPEPVNQKGTARMSSLLMFDDERLERYANDIE